MKLLAIIILSFLLTAWTHGNPNGASGNFLLDNTGGFLLDGSSGKLVAQ